MKKKILMVFLAGVLTLSAVGCGSKKEDAKTTAESNVLQEETDTNVFDEVEEEAKEEEKAEVENTEEEKTDVEDAMAAALENMKSVTNMEAVMLMEMDMNMSADGESQSLESVTSMETVFFSDPRKIKVEINVDMGEAGSAQQSLYGEVAEDGTATMYVFDGATWQSQVVGTADLEQYDASDSMISFIDDGAVYTLDGMESVDGANAYKYSSVISGEEAKQEILSAGALDSFSSLGLTANQLEGMLDDVGEITEYVWIDEATLYPVKYESDMTAVMDTLMSKVVESMGEQAQGLSIGISKMKISMTCSNFNNATDFTIPEEAKAAN